MDNGEGTAYNSVGSFQTNEMEYASGVYRLGHNINDIPIEYNSTDDPRKNWSILNLETMSNTYLMKIRRHTL